jgi:hypothetical protein
LNRRIESPTGLPDGLLDQLSDESSGRQLAATTKPSGQAQRGRINQQSTAPHSL